MLMPKRSEIKPDYLRLVFQVYYGLWYVEYTREQLVFRLRREIGLPLGILVSS